MKILIYDIETLKELFLVCIYVPETDSWFEFEIGRYAYQLDAFLRFTEAYEDYYWVGYNNLRFDAQVVEWVLRNHERWNDKTGLEVAAMVAQKGKDTIDDSNFDVFPDYREDWLSLKQIDLFKIHHFDNKNRRVSLKRLEFEMDLENIEEMPISPDKEDMTIEEINETKRYCRNDVWATYQFYLITIGETEHPLYKENNQIELRQSIEEEFQIPCLNYSNAKIGDEIIKKYYCETMRIGYAELPKKGFFRKYIDLKECIPTYVKFKTPQLQAFLKDIKTRSLKMSQDFEESIQFYDQTYTFAKGGLHNVISGKVYESNEDNLLLDIDVSGYYPATIINNSYYPKHLGKSFLVGYSRVYYKRLELKPLAKTDKKVKGIVAGLKEAGNCPYGKSSDVTSWLYDKQMTLATCITGELSILMLIEECELNGIKSIMANTDGATFIVPKIKRQLFNQIKEEWREKTKRVLTYELEETEYKKMIFSTVNDYIAIKPNGETKKKGDFLTDFELHKNKSARIIPIALEHYFVSAVDVGDTIRNHNNIYDFCLRQKASKDFHYEGRDRISNERRIYNKLIRYYVSNTGEKLYKVKNPEYESNAPEQIQIEAGEWLCTVCNYLPKDASITDINYDYYIERAERIIRKIKTRGKKEKPVNKVIPGQLSLF